MSLVVDASAIAELVVARGQGAQVARAVLDHELFAPQLLVPEVVSVVWGWVLGRHLDAVRASAALEDFRSLDVTLVDMVPLVDEVWRLRDNVTAYDGMYVALARGMGCPLLTLDAKLIAALPTDVTALSI